jgi:Fe-S-cluster containining protein
MKHTGMSASEFVQFYPAKLLNQDWRSVLFFFDKGDLPDYSILALKSWPCIFLKRGKCSIHGFSPFACRRYPHDIAGNLKRRDCSILSQAFFLINGPAAQENLKDLENYKSIVADWNAKKGKRQDCLKFLLKKTADFKE